MDLLVLKWALYKPAGEAKYKVGAKQGTSERDDDETHCKL